MEPENTSGGNNNDAATKGGITEKQALEALSGPGTQQHKLWGGEQTDQVSAALLRHLRPLNQETTLWLCGEMKRLCAASNACASSDRDSLEKVYCEFMATMSSFFRKPHGEHVTCVSVYKDEESDEWVPCVRCVHYTEWAATFMAYGVQSLRMVDPVTREPKHPLTVFCEWSEKWQDKFPIEIQVNTGIDTRSNSQPPEEQQSVEGDGTDAAAMHE